jgi:hypothetical protein
MFHNAVLRGIFGSDLGGEHLGGCRKLHHGELDVFDDSQNMIRFMIRRTEYVTFMGEIHAYKMFVTASKILLWKPRLTDHDNIELKLLN